MTTLEDIYLEKFDSLLLEGKSLKNPDKSSGGYPYSSHEQYSKICAWVTSSLSILQDLVGNNHPYYNQVEKQSEQITSYTNAASINAGTVHAVLEKVKDDFNSGLLKSLRARVEAETFDDFLAHAESYFAENKTMESGVISGVVFEDTIKRICVANDISIDGKRLDQLISALNTQGFISKPKASRCRTAAGVRNAATHANWSELDLGSIRDTISLTRELLDEFLGA